MKKLIIDESMYENPVWLTFKQAVAMKPFGRTTFLKRVNEGSEPAPIKTMTEGKNIWIKSELELINRLHLKGCSREELMLVVKEFTRYRAEEMKLR